MLCDKAFFLLYRDNHVINYPQTLDYTCKINQVKSLLCWRISDIVLFYSSIMN